MRKVLTGAIACAALAVAGAAAAPALATTGGCQLSGTAVFGTPLTTSAQPFTYSFHGELTNCKGDEPFPATGTITSNEPLVIDGITYRPSYTDSGTGSCGSSTTSGTALVTWADGTITVIKYTTTGATAAIKLDGTTAASVTYVGTNALGETVTKTFTSTRLMGGTSTGLLVFEANPQDCLTGVRSAGIAGLVGVRA